MTKRYEEQICSWCKGTGMEFIDNDKYYDDEPCMDCAGTGSTTVCHRIHNAPPRGWTCLNVYLEDRAYGGPEEGGWWYSTMEPVRTILTRKVDAERNRARLQRVLDAWNSNRRSNVCSVRSEGRFTMIQQNHPARHTPEERPYYC